MKPPYCRWRLAALAATALLLMAAPTARADQIVQLASETYAVGPQYIAMQPWMSATGWDIQHLNITYDVTTDTLLVDIKTMVNPTTGQQTIAGDADGLGIPGQYDPQLMAAGGYNPANLGGRGSIDVAFMSATSGHALGSPIAIAGVPEYKAANAPSDGFQFAQYTGSPTLQAAYGAPITSSTGTLLGGGPTATFPDFSFTISNFSKLYGLSLANGFYISAFAGSPDDVVAGEDTIPWTFVQGYNPQQQIPNQNPTPGSTSPGLPELTPAPQVVNVPEPSSLALCGAGGLGLWLASRKRRARTA